MLEAGCGFIRYVKPSWRPVLLDYSYTALAATRGAVVGSVECLPFKSGTFTVVICVGSVLNLVDPEVSLRELVRVASPSGLLILEYERSESYMTSHASTGGHDIVSSVCEYQGVQHPLQLYSDRFVDAALRAAGAVVIRRMYFHVLSAALLRQTSNPALSSLGAAMDFLPLPDWLRRRAANAIILARRA